MRVIALCGPKGSGKDTAVESLYMFTPVFFVKRAFAAGVKGVCADFFGWDMQQMDNGVFKETPIPLWAGGPVVEPRWPMMDIANWLRDKYGPDIHVQRWERNALANDHPDVVHVVPDLRFPNELAYMEKHKALVIYIERPEAEERLARSQQAGDSMALNPSESHYTLLKAYAQESGVIIRNDKSIGELQDKVLEVVLDTFGIERR